MFNPDRKEKRRAGDTPAPTAALALRLTAPVEEAVDGMPQAFPIDWFGEMLREARRFGRRDITVRSETAEGNSTQLTGIAQFAHQIQAAAVGQTEVADHESKTAFRRQITRAGESRCVPDLKPGIFQHPAQRPRGVFMVFHQQDFCAVLCAAVVIERVSRAFQ